MSHSYKLFGKLMRVNLESTYKWQVCRNGKECSHLSPKHVVATGATDMHVVV
jgi:hypothetical protein